MSESARDPIVFEQYKLAVEMADRTSARRSAANSFYVTVQGALVATLGFLSGLEGVPPWALAAVCLVGCMTSVAWFLLLRSYRDLNAAKYTVICRVEEQLPLRLFGDEWLELKKDEPIKRWRGRYAELGTIERLLPAAFALLNIALALYLGLA